MADTYRVLKNAASFELKVKGSRFIARALPVRSREEVDAQLEDVRRVDRDATHHCFAYRIGPDGVDHRQNDDGEPSGTAGAPILRQVEAHELSNTLVVVTRYFGGTKLGTGGLIRAYGDAARAVLDAADTGIVVDRAEMVVEFEYPDTSPAMQVIQKFDTRVRETVYGERTRIQLGVRRSQCEAFVEAFRNALGGRGSAIPDAPD